MRKKRFVGGQTLGQWKLIKKIGEGGNGEVWSAHKIKNNENKVCAIKLSLK